MTKLRHKELFDKIIGAYYNGYNTLGFGFLVNVYENAFNTELKVSDNLYLEHEYQLTNYLKATNIEVGFFI